MLAAATNKWTETAFSRGVVAGTSHWTAILTIVRRVPGNADVLRKNPLGIYVDAIDWSRELEPQPQPATPSALSAPSPAPLSAPIDAPASSEESTK
jgi:hypothetical protein